MPKMKITREKRAEILRGLKGNLGKSTFEEIGSVASDSIIVNLKTSKQASGQSLKENAPSTKLVKRIRRRLWQGRTAPLIDQRHRFIQPGQGGSWRYWARNDQVIIEPGTEWLKRISKILQERGYTGWFGVSKKGWALIKGIVKKRLLQIVASRAAK